ncbi:NAD-dependent epimerase/dehydratase family protein [Demequina oxidasica]|uniref:NAD-dependent epimerase/dehydratase family protein n=1 Tax=Demequina oxidasica TaxID=676199 RepID=UPI000785A9FC|nr:NAD-dependent epimerase/dehydratase family protein [Demequina oxidasica]
MKVVVLGASGNVGTAVLRALRAANDVTEVAAVARRIPRRTPPAPYDIATWTSVDIGSRDGRQVTRTLARAMEGADAVIHLAWAIQPNHDRDRLRRTNILGTSRVLDAARSAGVDHVVVASSVGAYSPCHDDQFHDESWPTMGVPTSEYSVDKADLEELLNRHQHDHPEVLITRLRPAMIFQHDAGSEIMRYFIGRLVPGIAFNGHLPAITWPDDTRIQALHADDVAQAYLGAVRTRPGGALNVAADDVLGGPHIASLLSDGRFQRVPTLAVRAAVSAGWNARILPVSPGWVDMAATFTLMSTARARSVLGWAPRHTALDTVAEVLDGMVKGAGTASPPLRPRGGAASSRWRRDSTPARSLE